MFLMFMIASKESYRTAEQVSVYFPQYIILTNNKRKNLCYPTSFLKNVAMTWWFRELLFNGTGNS